jgi:signal peptidase II
LRALQDGPIEVVWTLEFDLTFNTGAAFSRGEGFGPLIGIAAALVAVGLLWSGRTVPNRLGAVAVGIIVGGAAGNLCDRAFRRGDGFLGGAVVDFIDLNWYPVFNVADMAVVGGAVLLLIATARAGDPEDDDEPEPAPAGP